MVVQALVFAIGPVTRIFMLADHFPARYGRRGHLQFAASANARGQRYYLPLAASVNVVWSAVSLAACGDRRRVLSVAVRSSP